MLAAGAPGAQHAVWVIAEVIKTTHLSGLLKNNAKTMANMVQVSNCAFYLNDTAFFQILLNSKF